MADSVFITGVSAFLPGEPVSNQDIEDVLGYVNGKRSRAKNIILRSNGIKSRHYAMDRTTGLPTHTNAALTAEAVRRLESGQFQLSDMDCLCCGTSSPDQLMPNHAVMVHGELRSPPCEVVGTSGICVAGMTALKYAYLAVRAGGARNAVATGSEIASTFMLARNFEGESQEKVAELETRAEVAFEKDFLRWMLSDGAGAVLLQRSPPPEGRALRVDWIDQLSFANDLEPCMYCGGDKDESGRLVGWREYPDPQDILRQSLLAVKQDVRLLNDNIVAATVERGLDTIRAKHGLRPEQIDHFLPHYSSAYFRDRLLAGMANIDFVIPQDKWFTNLATKGNTGSASIFIMLEELFHNGRLRPGEQVLCYVPESGRFSVAYMLLTVV